MKSNQTGVSAAVSTAMLMVFAGAVASAADPSPISRSPIVSPAGPIVLAPVQRGFFRPGATEGAASGIPDSCVYFDDYASYTLTDLANPPTSLTPFDGQPNLVGITWSSSSFYGAANASVLQAIGATPPAGAPPHGLAVNTFAMAARGALNTGYNPDLGVMGDYRHNLFFPTIGNPVVVSQDVYIESTDNQPRTTIWWSPVSFLNNSIYDRVFFGGTHLQDELSGFSNASGVTDRFLSLGHFPSGIGETFYGSAVTSVFPFPVNEWFTLMVHTSIGPGGAGGYSLWIKTAGTVASDPPLIDPRMTNGDITPIDGDPVGWVNTYPGRGDNLATPQVREGIGLAHNRFGDGALQTSHLGQAPIFDNPTFDGVQYGWGFDDPLNTNFQPDNYFFGNYCVTGDFTQAPCPADLSGDGVVNGADLATLLTNWGPDAGFGPVDLNVDGVIDGGDLAILLINWGSCA